MADGVVGGGTPPDLFGMAAVRRYEAALSRQLGPSARAAGLEIADLLQEMLHRAWRWQAASPVEFAAAFPDEDSFQAWAAVVIGNLVTDHRRSWWRRRVSLQAEIDEAIAGVSPGAEQVALAQMVLPLLARLSKRDGRALWLREVEGRSYAEIARELDVPEAQVPAILHRARRRLRETYRLAVGGITLPPILRRGWWRPRAGELPRVPAEVSAGLADPVTARVLALALGLTATMVLPGGPVVPGDSGARLLTPGDARQLIPLVPVAAVEPQGGTGRRPAAVGAIPLYGPPSRTAVPVPWLPGTCAPRVCVGPNPAGATGDTLWLKPLGGSPHITQNVVRSCEAVPDNPAVGCRREQEPENWLIEQPTVADPMRENP